MKGISAVFLAFLVTIGNSENQRDPDCPYPDLDVPVYYPYTYDCAKYYECANGLKILEICPTGLFWDIHRNVCNVESEVDCSQVMPETTPLPTSTTTTAKPPLTTVTRSTTAEVTPTTVTRSTTAGITSTTVTRSTTAGITSTTVTRSTTAAVTSTTVTRSTTAGVTSTTVTRSTTAEVTSAASSSSINTASTTIDPSGMCEGQADGTYLSYPGDNKKFIECAHQYAYILTCPGDTFWNESILTCC